MGKFDRLIMLLENAISSHEIDEESKLGNLVKKLTNTDWQKKQREELNDVISGFQNMLDDIKSDSDMDYDEFNLMFQPMTDEFYEAMEDAMDVSLLKEQRVLSTINFLNLLIKEQDKHFSPIAWKRKMGILLKGLQRRMQK